MNLLRIFVASILALLALEIPAAAQGCGPANPNCIVPTAPVGTSNNQAASTQFVQQNISSGPTSSAALDSTFGSTRGSILERGATLWQIIPPGTSGLPWVSNGAGADPAYQALANAGLATMPANTIKGSIAGGAPSDLTATQLTTLCNAFTSSLSGCAPASGGGTSNFLRADGTWAAPGGAGSAITALTGDVVATGPGSVTATIQAGVVTNTDLATMAVNSIKANTSTSTGSPVDFGTATGTAQHVFGSLYTINVPGLDIASGSTGSPITTQGPTIRFSRVENISPGASVCSNNNVDNECNATLATYSAAISTDGMQNTAFYAGATSSSTVSASIGPVGGSLVGRVTGSGIGIGTGAYMEGRRDTNTGKALGTEIRVTNQTATAGTYNSSGFQDTAAMWITAGGNSNSSCGVCLGPAGEEFSVGFAATAGAIAGATFRDDSSSPTSILINGTHATAQITGTGFGVDPNGIVTAIVAQPTKMRVQGSTPGISGCGSGATISGSDFSGTVTIGTSPSTCVITFAASYVSAPYCVVTTTTSNRPNYTRSNTALSLTSTVAADVYFYTCVGQSGG
jgi:hypothetical protein